MERKSHIDREKMGRLFAGQSFEYRDVVEDDFPTSKHSEAGAEFKREVESGLYPNTIISNEDDTHIVYKRI